MFALATASAAWLAPKLQMAHIAISNTIVLGTSGSFLGKALALPGIPKYCDVARQGKPLAQRAAGESVGNVSLVPYFIAGLLAILVTFAAVPPVRKWAAKNLGWAGGMLLAYGAIFGTIMAMAPNTPKC